MHLRKLVANAGLYFSKLYPNAHISYDREMISLSFDNFTIEISFTLLEKTVKNVSLGMISNERKKRDLKGRKYEP